jgi:hypothetical protein
MRIGWRRTQRPTLADSKDDERSRSAESKARGEWKSKPTYRPTSQPFLAKVVPHRSFLRRGTDLLHFPTADEI